MKTFVLEDVAIPEPNTGCWLWAGGFGDTGYGSLRWEGKTQNAHSVSYRVHKGPIPRGKVCRHRCDQRACVNPDHLLLGTARDNSRDMIERGRAAVGDRNGSRRRPERFGRGDTHWSRQATNHSPEGKRSKLDVETVRYVKEFLAMGIFSQYAIARRVGVHPSVINRIASGHRWKQVA